MGSGFGSIDQLMKQTPQKGASAASTYGTAGDKLAKKMSQIKKQEFEVEAQRNAAGLGGEYPYISLQKFPLSQEALKLIPREKAETLQAICFFINNDEFRIGALNPEDPRVHDLVREIEEFNYSHGVIYLISEESIKRVFDLYNTLPIIKPITKDVEISADELLAVQADIHNFSAVQDALKHKSTTDILTIVLGAGLKLDASDVHIEAEETKIVVRLRLDGILYDVASLDLGMLKQLVSRIKLVSSLKINITDKPQDGRFTIKLPNGDVDVRVSVIPTVYGESIVMRLLRQNQEALTLDQLGLTGRAFELLTQEINRPNGMILTTGPTGSGKTTTLYAVLTILNKPGVKILTLEDPVEYRIEGVNQSQIDHSKDYTFAKGLRSILRQDPDIVMVGEIRDLETADIAVQAALTGHLMLSTVHTNSAAGSIPRLLAMGVKSFLLTPALNAVIGQRLIRRLVQEHKTIKHLEAYDVRVQEHVRRLLDHLPDEYKQDIAGKPLDFYVPIDGAEEKGEAYKGRIGIYEIFRLNDEIKSLMSNGNIAEYEISEAAKKSGMITMAQDGVLKALAGFTSLEEVFRVID